MHTQHKINIGHVDVVDDEHMVEMKDLLQRSANDMLDVIMREFVSFDMPLNRTDLGDPLTINMVYTGDDEVQHWASFSLSDILELDIDACREDGSYSENLQKVSTALKSLADRIDKAVQESQNTQRVR